MKVAFFSNPGLKVGDLAMGFPTDKELAALVGLPNNISESALRSACRDLHILLYEVIEIVQRKRWFYEVHYCKVCRCSDGHVLKVGLTGVPLKWPWADKVPSRDPRSDWLRIEMTPAT